LNRNFFIKHKLGLEQSQQKDVSKVDEGMEVSSTLLENHDVEKSDGPRAKRTELLQPKIQANTGSTRDVTSKDKSINSDEELARRLQAEADFPR